MPNSTPANIAVFTYGTLQPGQALWSMLGPYLPAGKSPATAYVKGYELYANKSGTYPYLVPRPGMEHRLVFGTITFLPYVTGGALERICEMEVGAGYDTEVVEARYMQADAKGQRFFTDVKALAFTWKVGRPSRIKGSTLDDLYIGERIESGSWAEWCEQSSLAVPEELEKIPANRSPQALAIRS